MSSITVVENYINGAFCPPSSGEFLDVINPANDAVIGKVAVSTVDDVNQAVDMAQKALESWSNMTIKARAAVMLRFHGLIRDHAQELAELIVLENGKNITEALADVAKGNETVEYACSLPQLAQGRTLQVSGQVYCQDRRQPLGVIASIVPFNFPVSPCYLFLFDGRFSPVFLVIYLCLVFFSFPVALPQLWSTLYYLISVYS
jgi:malonate-semialdehyde dehydrogenase (acetylating)/methylmalonate-semialdehyde dehydrogenase